jgi:hypothetical protein
MRATKAVLLLFIAAAPAAGAELYRWVDENGVVNYSNTPPAKTQKGKPPTIVEDRISVYTPEQSLTEAIERRRNPPPPPSASVGREPLPERRVIAPPPPPPPVGYDPCANPNDVNCPGYLYDGSAVFQGRRRHLPPLVQPQLPPGTIAGHAAGPNAYIPGQSGAAAPPPLPPSRSSGGSLGRQPLPEPEHHHRRR